MNGDNLKAEYEIDRIMEMSDEEILADAIQEYGSEKAVDVIVGLQRRLIVALAAAARARQDAINELNRNGYLAAADLLTGKIARRAAARARQEQEKERP